MSRPIDTPPPPPTDTIETPDGWEGLLDAGERITWQGQPAGGLVPSDFQWHLMGFGLFFMGFSVFWMLMAAQGGGAFWMFGLPFFAIGFFQGFGRTLWRAALRRRTFYTLTDKRAFIAVDHPLNGKSLASYPIRADTPLEFRPGPYSSIYFAKPQETSNSLDPQGAVGFERIEGANQVYALMRQMQESDRA